MVTIKGGLDNTTALLDVASAMTGVGLVISEAIIQVMILLSVVVSVRIGR